MSDPVVYVDTSVIHEGRLEEVRAAVTGLAGFVEANEPGLLGYAAYFDETESRMTVIHVHADPPSLDFHMQVAGSRFAPFAELLTLQRIDVYGEPSSAALELLGEKARRLGRGTVSVHRMQAGFLRASPSRPS